MSGRMVHFEVPTDDVERARAFYNKVFGWQTMQFGDMPYWGVTTTPSGEMGMPTEPGAINGGMMPRSEPATTPVLVIEVADLDASMKEIEANGGSAATQKEPVGDMGFYAYFKDSEGNLMGMWESAQPG